MGNDTSTPDISSDSKEYFDLINQKISNETRNQNYEHLKFMQTKPLKNWKTSLIKYSEKQLAMGIQWYKELKDQLMKTSFNSEEKYLELFFWQKFEMRTKPRCLNQSKPSEVPSSITDSTMSEYQLNKEKTTEYINIFKNHLSNKDHPITICMNIFLKIFCQELQFHINHIKTMEDNDERKEHSKLLSEAISEQLVLYIFKLQKCFGYMYSKALAYKYFKKEKEDFITLFTSMFFSNKNLYNLLMELFTLTIQHDIDSFKEHLIKLNEVDIQPCDLGINIKFRLDRSTEKAQVDFLLKNNIDLSDDKLIYLNTYHKRDYYVAYESAIELLKTIADYQTPYDKIKVLASISSDVVKSVMEAWKVLEEHLPRNYLTIDGDELILIFSFIVIRARMPELLTHLFLIKNFTTQDTKSSMIGYYYTTIEASIITVKSLDLETLEEKEKLKKRVVLPGVGLKGFVRDLPMEFENNNIKEDDSKGNGENKEEENDNDVNKEEQMQNQQSDINDKQNEDNNLNIKDQENDISQNKVDNNNDNNNDDNNKVN